MAAVTKNINFFNCPLLLSEPNLLELGSAVSEEKI
jgi:hypothetical protein